MRCNFRVWIILAGIALLALVFAATEIQIEGAAGWAANLPTWRIERHPLLDLFWGSRPLTGYHAGIFLFMFLVFHLVFCLQARPSWRLEARVLGSLMVFWIVEDILWFALNPAFGFRRLNPIHAPWHRHWWLGVPADYILFTAAGVVLLQYSFRRRRRPAL
jgi:hypothetical protein